MLRRQDPSRDLHEVDTGLYDHLWGQHSTHKKQPKQRPPGQNVLIREEQGGNSGKRSTVVENEVQKAVRETQSGKEL